MLEYRPIGDAGYRCVGTLKFHQAEAELTRKLSSNQSANLKARFDSLLAKVNPFTTINQFAPRVAFA